jgi:outer membrane protein insertion porin family
VCLPALTLVFACLGLAYAQDAQQALRPRVIKVVLFEPSEQPFTLEELDRFTGIKAGDSIAPARIRTAIQNLFSTGRYADIAVDAEDSPEGTVLKFLTEPAYFVSQVLVTGAKDPPNEGQLSGAAKLQLGTEFRESGIQIAIDNMQDRLRANGFYQALIRPEIVREPRTQQAHITFHVDAGQRARFDGIKLSGTPSLSSDAIIRATHWMRFFGLMGWRSVTENRVRTGIDGIQGLFQSRDLLLSRVALQRLEYHDLTNTNTPHLDINPGPKVLLRARGEKISRSRLKQFVPIFQERSVDRDLLVEGRRNLLEYFQSQGYFDAQVGFELLPRQKEEQIVEYVLARGERHRLAQLEIKGNRYFDEKTIRERIAITPATFLRYRRGRYGQKLLDKDIEAIRGLYRSNGFQEAVIIPRIVDGYKGKKSDIAVTLDISEGRQWFVRKLEIEGIPDEDRASLQNELSSLEGQPFSEVNIFTDRDSVLSYYFNRGYPDAAFEWSLGTSNPDEPTQIDLKFTVRTGRRQYVKDVLVSGLNITRPKIVDDRIRFSKGEPLADASLADTQRRLYDLGIFAKVQVAMQNPGGNEDSKNVLYQLDEARRYSVNGGFGAEIARIGGGTSFNAPAGGTGFAPRVLLGVSRINFLGLGHTISLQTRASNIQQRVLLSYFAPQFQSSENLNLTITGLFDSSRDVRTFAARRLESSIQLGQRLSRANSMQYRYAFRRVGVDENTLNINPQLIPLFSQPVRTSIFSMTFIQDRRDDPLDAKRGIYNTLDFGFSSSAFGSRASFLRLVARNASYHRVNSYLTFARSFNFGIIQRTGSAVDIPLPERFFSGGSFSHRGFPNNQAGPRDDVTGFPLGGNALLMNSLELRFPLIGDNLGGVVFHDAGNVYSEFRKISLRYTQHQNPRDFDYMAQALGLGFRYKTPIGPLRVDFGFSPNAARFSGFTGTRDELLRCAGPATVDPTRPRCSTVSQRINPFQFHFSLGQAF